MISAAPLLPVVRAETFWDEMPGTSMPVRLGCDDGNDYVCKGQGAPGRSRAAESIVGVAGRLLGAPVGEVVHVLVPDELIDAQRELVSFQAEGIAHGCRWIRGCFDGPDLLYVSEGYNRARFALIEALYSWVGANDRQLMYKTQPPHEVFSMDHNHFFPGGPNWTGASLATAPAAERDPHFGPCVLTAAERNAASLALQALTEAQIAEIAAAPHPSWGVDLQEKVQIAEYLYRRRKETVDLL